MSRVVPQISLFLALRQERLVALAVLLGRTLHLRWVPLPVSLLLASLPSFPSSFEEEVPALFSSSI